METSRVVVNSNVVFFKNLLFQLFCVSASEPSCVDEHGLNGVSKI